jgi:hypothetical protein
VEVFGTVHQRELARLCIDITLQQREQGRIRTDFTEARRASSHTRCHAVSSHRRSVAIAMLPRVAGSIDRRAHASAPERFARRWADAGAPHPNPRRAAATLLSKTPRADQRP